MAHKGININIAKKSINTVSPPSEMHLPKSRTPSVHLSTIKRPRNHNRLSWTERPTLDGSILAPTSIN